MVTGYSGAIWKPSPNYGGLGDASHKRFILVHGSGGGTINSVANEFADPASQVSSTYIVGTDETVYQCVDEMNAAYANGVITGTPLPGGIGLPEYGDGIHRDPWWSEALNPNDITISIEHIKNSDNSNALTAAQQATSFALIKDICQRWNIPMRPADANGGITGHYSIDGLYRPHCPGPYPWSNLWTFLQQGDTPLTIDLSNTTVASYFTGSDTYWQCKQTNCTIGHAMLAFYRSFGGDALCGLTHLGLPRTNEVSAHPQHSEVVEQVFERAIVRYDPNHVIDAPPDAGEVYIAHIDSTPPGTQYQQYVTAIQQIKQITAKL